MAYHEGEGKAFTKSPAVLMCPRSSGQWRLISLLATSNWNLLKLSSKHTKQQPYWFSKCLGIPSGWHGGVCGEPGSKTNGQRRQTIHNVPFQVYAVMFPFCSAQRDATQTSMNSLPIIFAAETNDNRNDWKQLKGFTSEFYVCIQVRQCPPWLHQPLGLSVYYQPALCQLATILVSFKIESFTLPYTVPS